MLATVGIVLFGQGAAQVRHPAPMGRDLSWPAAQRARAKDIAYVPVLADPGHAAPNRRTPVSTTPSVHAAAWWRPQSNRTRLREAATAGPALRPRRRAASTANVVAFRALVAFTVILLLSPQAWFPVLGQLRIAFVAAAITIGAHLLDRLVRRDAAPPFSPEIGIALILVAWAVITVPVSYWVGGSVEVLTNQYLKAVAFFWLVGTLATTERRLRTIAWTLVLCAIPLAVTGSE